MTPPPTDIPDIADPSTFAARAQAWVAWQKIWYAELAAIIGITIPAGSAAAGTLTGNTLAANIINSSLAMRGGIAGLTLSNNATATKLDVAAGICKDSTNAVSITLAAAITAGLIQTSGAWAAGSTQNKLDTGARANSTWYHVWAIMKDSDNSGDFLFSLSASAPTMPAGYTYKRRIGSVLTDGSGNITAFSQNGDEFLWPVTVNAGPAGNSNNSTASLITLAVPTGLKVNAMFRGSYYQSLLLDGLLFTSPDETDQVPAGSGVGGFASLVADNTAARTGQFSIRTDTSGRVRIRTEINQGGSYISLRVYGWMDTRGRDS